jgi:hypothetical protein
MNIDKVPAILSLTKARLKKATFKASDGKVRTIDDNTFHYIWAFKKNVGYLNSLPDPD